MNEEFDKWLEVFAYNNFLHTDKLLPNGVYEMLKSAYEAGKKLAQEKCSETIRELLQKGDKSC